MFLKLNGKSNMPIWEQIVHGIKEQLLKKVLQPGDKIPSVRELSSMLTINPNTVSKAYQELERQGVIETFRGKGTFVSQDFQAYTDPKQLQQFQSTLKQLLVEASYLGISEEQLVQYIQQIAKELKGDDASC